MVRKNKNKEGKIKRSKKVVRKTSPASPKADMAKSGRSKKRAKPRVYKKSQVKKIKIRSSQKTIKKPERGMTLRGIEAQKENSKKIQNLTAVLLIVLGLFVGSLFVDIAQFVTKNGYSERALREADVFELGDKTWVAYQEPAIKVDILVADDEENCPTCKADEILVWMKKFMPTMVVNEISESSLAGIKLINKYDLKTIPSFVFDEKVQEASFFKEDQVQEIFERKENGLVLNATALGIPAGKYLETPGEKAGDIVIGEKDVQVKLITFFDFQCPYSRIFYEAAKEARGEFVADQLTMVYKSFPLDLHGQAISAALAGQCAYQQGRFEEMADLLFANQQNWGVTEDFKIFEQYALRIGLDKKQFDECTNSEESQELIQESINQGDQFGIAGTPASFIGDEFLNGIFQKEGIVEIVNEKLQQN